jgi:hypothetical protein
VPMTMEPGRPADGDGDGDGDGDVDTSADEGRLRATKNALAGSRTAAGELDVRATRLKASEMTTELAPVELSARTLHNVTAAVELCWAGEPTSADTTMQLIEAVNLQLVDDLLVGTSIRRSSVSERFPYASPERAGVLLRQLAEIWPKYEVQRRRRPRDAAALAAYITWVVDLYGHPFVDGCGKTAALLSGFALDRAGVKVPLMPGRADVIAAAYYRGSPSWSHWCRWYVRLVGVD